MLKHPIARIFLLSALFLALLYCFGNYTEAQRAFFYISTDEIIIQDYFYYISIVNSWWSAPSNPYDPSFHMHFLSELAGYPVNNFMPLGLTPTFLMLLLPFGILARGSVLLSYYVWVAIALSASFWVMWDAVALTGHRKRQIFILVLCFATLFSQAAISGIVLGQSSIFGLAILAFFALPSQSNRRYSSWIRGVLLILLSIKVHYLILGGSLLLIKRDYRAINVACIVLLFATAITWLYGGLLLYPEYLESLRYFAGNSGNQQVDVVALRTSNTFRSAFAELFGINLSSTLSKIILGILLTWSLIATVRRKGSSNSLFPYYLAGLGLLCFMPYIGRYDDILILGFLVVSDMGIKSSRVRVGFREFVAVVLLILILNREEIWPTVGPLQFALKIAFFVTLFWMPKNLGSKPNLAVPNLAVQNRKAGVLLSH